MIGWLYASLSQSRLINQTPQQQTLKVYPRVSSMSLPQSEKNLVSVNEAWHKLEQLTLRA